MKQAGCNMGNTQAYVRATVALFIALVALKYELWYLLIFSAILFYTAYQKYCLMFSLFGINKKLRIENYYHALLPKNSPYLSCIFNDNAELLYMNNTAKKIFSKITHPAGFGIEDFKEQITQSMQTERIFEHEGRSYKLRTCGINEERTLLIYIDDITDILFLQFQKSELENRVEDVLSENQLKDRLLAQQSKFTTTGELIENIVHQWRQPLGTLASIIVKNQFTQKFDDEEVREDLQKAADLVQIMNRTIDDFRNFFKEDKRPELFCVKDSIKDVMLILGASLQREGIDVIQNVQMTNIKGYKNEFSQVLLNIVNNAKDAFAENKTDYREIKIDTKQENNELILTISDTAGGIPQQYLDKVFDSHFTTKEKEGTGIGLHMSKVIIEKDMHGSIEVKNNPQGAAFIIKVPIAF